MNHFMKTVTLLMVMLICVLSGCKNQSGSNGTFEIGDKTFLLNGKPFIIKAAEIHYTRIPVERQRFIIRVSRKNIGNIVSRCAKRWV